MVEFVKMDQLVNVNNLNFGEKQMMNILVKRISLFLLAGVFFIMLPINVMAGCTYDQLVNKTWPSDKRCEHSNLPGSNLSGLSLRILHLEYSNLRGATMVGTDLTSADLTGADLRGAKLGRACLENIILENADLRGADLSGADLKNSWLKNAKLKGASLKGADLSGAIWTNGKLCQPGSIGKCIIKK
jgi:uncharacterized protein YjbI with pentapeptide repeats